jgi:hypothetical protein
LGILLSIIALVPPYWSTAYVSTANAPTNSDLKERYREQKFTAKRSISIQATKEELQDYLAFKTANTGLYEEMCSVIQGESGFNPLADNGISVGIAQFTLPTWLENCSSIDERKNPYKSIDCMIKLWDREEKWRWDVWCMGFGKNNLKCIARGF